MRESLQQLGLWVAIGLVLGAVFSGVIVRYLRGIRAVAGILVLSLIPYAVVLAVIQANIDPTLTPAQAQYNSQMAFALFVIGFTVPWIVACLIGGLIGKRMRASTSNRDMGA